MVGQKQLTFRRFLSLTTLVPGYTSLVKRSLLMEMNLHCWTPMNRILIKNKRQKMRFMVSNIEVEVQSHEKVFLFL